MAERLPLAQVVIPGSWDRVPHSALHREPGSLSAYVFTYLSLCVPHECINKFFVKKGGGDAWVAQQLSVCL